MAANVEKQRIRLCKVYERLCKRKYPTDPKERLVVKAVEGIAILERHSTHIWAEMYRAGFVAGKSNSDPKFYQAFDELSAISKKIERLSNRIDRIFKQKNTSELEIMAAYSRLNSRLSVSF